MKFFSCDLCGADDPIEVPRCREYTGGQAIHICSRCGFVYVQYRRTADEIAGSWSDDIYGEGYTSAIPAVKARHLYVAEFVENCIGLNDKKLIDIGAGEGNFMLEASWQGAKCTGIEPSRNNVQQIIGCGFDCFQGTIESVATSQRFDVASVLWTLENCQDCNAMLSKAWELLKPGGHIVVATGSRILVPFKKPLQDYFSTNPADTHCFRFSFKTLVAMLWKNNFTTVDQNRFIDTDYLVVIARKEPYVNLLEVGSLKGDNPQAVASFFDRWHSESQRYA
ncbi:MAG: class I SAM-dependent methyltransferase [FCB group bacterium]|nr:class I SAM-dependent methyltransferase [FCB group bacterium]